MAMCYYVYYVFGLYYVYYVCYENMDAADCVYMGKIRQKYTTHANTHYTGKHAAQQLKQCKTRVFHTTRRVLLLLRLLLLLLLLIIIMIIPILILLIIIPLLLLWMVCYHKQLHVWRG